MECINTGPVYIWEWVGLGWVVAKSKTKKQDNTNGRAYSGYDVHMYPQWVNSPLQGLDRHTLTVETISGIHCQIRARHWHLFTICEFTWSAKKHSGKADLLILSSIGDKHVYLSSVVISWGNKRISVCV